jgi:hypothetical protein
VARLHEGWVACSSSRLGLTQSGTCRMWLTAVRLLAARVAEDVSRVVRFIESYAILLGGRDIMRALLILAFLLAFPVAASSQSCTTYGTQTYCSNGQTFSQYGNQTYDNRGNNWSTYGNSTYGSNGRNCTRYGNQLYCN